MKLLLDTCTFIWLCSEPARISKQAKSVLNKKPLSVAIHEVSIMEICFKVTSGKLELPTPPPMWIEEQISTWQLDVAPLSRSTIYRAGELALHHRDPFDRLLIASAIEARMTVLTPDQEFTKYPVNVVW